MVAVMIPAILSSRRPHLPAAWCMAAFAALAVLGPQALAKTQAASVKLNTAHGLHTAEFVTPEGKILVLLPDDMAAGDTISGTVTTEPAGRNEQERTANDEVLRGRVLEVGDRKVPASAGTMACHVPATAQVLQIVLSESNGRKAAKPLGTVAMPLALPANSDRAMIRIAQNPLLFDWPPAAMQGAPVRITGPFDGDSANTQVTVAGVSAILLAESPRQAVFATSTTLRPGPVELEVFEGPTATRGGFRNIRVQLSAPKTNLRKGEQTTITVMVTGLQGLDQTIPVQLRTTGPVATEGGNLQYFDIRPGDAGLSPEGTCRTTRTLTGSASGNFEMAADVVWAKPEENGLVGKIVHVEGEPGGKPGRWRVPVILPNQKEKHGAYFDGDKPPDLHYCNWIEIKAAEKRDGIEYVTEYVRTTDPTRKSRTEPRPPSKPDAAPPVAPPVVPGTGSGSGEKTSPPPCPEGTIRILSSEEKTFTLLDGKQELFLQLYTDKDRVAIAAKEFADYLKTIADLGDKAGDLLPDGDGVGGATVGFLLKYLDQGSTVINKVLDGKLKLAGASEFTAVMSVGLRDVVATCTTLETCRNGAWAQEKKFLQTETKRRELFVKKAFKGDDEWEQIAASGNHIDPAAAAKWAQNFFKQQSEILKGNYDRLKEFKDRCK